MEMLIRRLRGFPLSSLGRPRARASGWGAQACSPCRRAGVQGPVPRPGLTQKAWSLTRSGRKCAWEPGWPLQLFWEDFALIFSCIATVSAVFALYSLGSLACPANHSVSIMLAMSTRGCPRATQPAGNQIDLSALLLLWPTGPCNPP